MITSTLYGTKRAPARRKKGDTVVDAMIGPPSADSESDTITHLLIPNDWRLSRCLRLAALTDRETPLFGDLGQETTWDARRWRKELQSAQWFVAKCGDEPAGIVKVVDYPDEDPQYHLESMWVKPEYRRRGIGNNLLEEAEAYTRSMGRSRLGLWVIEGNPAALTLYVNAGYRPTGRCGELMSGLRETEFARTID